MVRPTGAHAQPAERGVNQQAHHASWRKIDGIGKQQFAAK